MAEFKNPNTVITVVGIGRVSAANLTDELKKQIIAAVPDYEKYFKSNKKATT